MPSDNRYQTYDEVLGRYASAYNENRFDRLEEVLHPEFTIYGALGADGPRDRDGYREAAEALHDAFPDLQIAPDEGLSRIYEDDTSGHRVRFTGTHEGPFFGIDPTGNAVDVRWPWFARWEDGMILEKWDHPDVFTLLQQLGVVPADVL